MRRRRGDHPLPPLGRILRTQRARDPLAEQDFLRAIAKESGRVERTGEVLSLVLLETERARPEDLDRLLDYLQKRLRLTDELGWLEKSRLGVLLPATGGDEARKVAREIGEALGDARERFSCKVYSDDAGDATDASSNGDPGSAWAGPVEPLTPLFMVPMPWSKRAIDVLGALMIGMIAAPVMLLTAIAVRLQSPGPVIFRQTRVGHGGRHFQLYKFRSMIHDAEAMRDRLAANNRRDGPAFKLDNDPRVTRVGRFIRATGIDELPQLWNVLKGDMTLVGPRPPLPEEVRNYEAWQRKRLHVRGGLTCIWQVDGRLRNVSFRDWIRQDIRYGTRFSTGRDLALIARTAWVVCFYRGDH